MIRFLLPERISVLLLSELALSLACFSAAALLTAGPAALGFGMFWRVSMAAISVLLGCYLNGLYRDLQWRSRVSLVLHLSSVFGIALLIQGLLAYLQPGLELSRDLMFTAVALNFVFMVAWRIVYASLLTRLFAAEPVLFVGADSVASEIAAHIEDRPELGFRVAGFLSDTLPAGSPVLNAAPSNGSPPNGSASKGACVVGSTDDMAAVVAQAGVRRIIVATDEMRRGLPVAALMKARKSGIVVQDAGTAYELVCGRVCSRTFRPSQIIFANELATRPSAMALQSVYTNLLGLAAYVCAIPVLLLTSLAIRLTSRGPALIVETRLGLNGIPFHTSRFRCTTMDDTRRDTAAGRVIRALRLEYLPRVINLVRGDVGLVGPAPLRPEFAEYLAEMIPFYRQRQSVKPGLTGWTQIQSGPNNLPDALREIEYDLYYAKHISLALDAYILLHTLRGMLPFHERQDF